MAMRFTTSVMAVAFRAFALHEFQPGGRRVRTGRALRPKCPGCSAPGLTADTRPPSTEISAPLYRPMLVRERMASFDTEPIDGKASPRNPSERMS
jgi:hypothetical protein